MTDRKSILVEIAPGELFDKISILEIKSARIADPAKLQHVRKELAMLQSARESSIAPFDALVPCLRELKAVNEALWDIEDAIRAEETAARFGPRFIALARAVYQTNDRRAAIKKRINELFGSTLVEEKSYGTGTAKDEAEPVLEGAAGKRV